MPITRLDVRASDRFAELIRPRRYPRSSRYDPEWLLSLDMGPNPLWLLENLLPELEIGRDSLVLDLGSGRGASSVFLAHEFGARVTAADWWIRAADARRVFEEAGVGGRVHAVRAEAHALPFERGRYDLVTCIDAYEYFGADPAYLPYLAGFVRPGGRIAVATPALRAEAAPGHLPPHIAAVVGDEALRWHTAEWWAELWRSSGVVDLRVARLQPDGWQDWLLWQRAADRRTGRFAGGDVQRMLEIDGGQHLGFALLVADVR